MFKKIAIRSCLIFLLSHAGLVIAVVGLTQLAQESSVYGTSTWYLLVGGVAAIYLSLLLGAFFILWPIYSLVRTVKKIMRWREWILTDLPKIIAMIPALIEALRKAFAQSPEPSSASAAAGQSTKSSEAQSPTLAEE